MLALVSASEPQNAGLILQFRNPNLPEGSWFEVPKIGRTSPTSHSPNAGLSLCMKPRVPQTLDSRSASDPQNRGLGPPPAPAGLFPRPTQPGLGLLPPALTRRGFGVPGPGSDPTTRLLEPPGVTVLRPEPLLHLASPAPAAAKPTAGPGSQPRNRPRALQSLKHPGMLGDYPRARPLRPRDRSPRPVTRSCPPRGDDKMAAARGQRSLGPTPPGGWGGDRARA